MTRQYLGGDDTDEVCPSANGDGFVLLHEPHQFHEVDQEHDGLLLHEPHACGPHVGSLDPAGLLFLVVRRIIVHVDLASRPRPCHPRWYGTASQEAGEKNSESSAASQALDEQASAFA